MDVVLLPNLSDQEIGVFRRLVDASYLPVRTVEHVTVYQRREYTVTGKEPEGESD